MIQGPESEVAKTNAKKLEEGNSGLYAFFMQLSSSHWSHDLVAVTIAWGLCPDWSGRSD